MLLGKSLLTDRQMWEEGMELGCPNKRYNGWKWYALEKDPCPTCDFRSCHNRGMPTVNQRRFVIVKKSEEIKNG